MNRGASAAFAVAVAFGACGKNDSRSEIEAATSAVTIPVDGMACSRCASRVQRSLMALDGVGDAEVSLRHKRVVVHFEPHRTSVQKLALAIDATGFEAGTPGEVPR